MVNREAFEQVCKDLEGSDEKPPMLLTFAHIGAVFGEDFYFMLIESLMDAQDAARAIQNAMLRLSQSNRANEQV